MRNEAYEMIYFRKLHICKNKGNYKYTKNNQF